MPLQIFENKFPGADPKDCTKEMNTDTAKEKKCHNANYPDTYGHYRTPTISQPKHHWIWKLHNIFDEIIPKNIPNFNGFVALLEEDYYIAPDFLHVLRKAAQLTEQTKTRIITLGNYKDAAFGDKAKNFAINKWVSSRLNMGMSMTAETWKLVKGCVRV